MSGLKGILIKKEEAVRRIGQLNIDVSVVDAIDRDLSLILTENAVDLKIEDDSMNIDRYFQSIFED
jgi:hypothetical protein